MGVLVGKKAPLFEADAVVNGGEFVEKFSLEQYIGKKYVVFFFYPLDFTFVCPTEILAFQKKLDEFEKRNVAVVGCSVDSQFSHWAWLNTELKDGGIKGVKFPLVSDLSKTISENYDVLAGEYDVDEENGQSVFVGIKIDKKKHGVHKKKAHGIIFRTKAQKRITNKGGIQKRPYNGPCKGCETHFFFSGFIAVKSSISQSRS